MDDKTLADRIVELGIGTRVRVTHRNGRVQDGYAISVEYDHCLTADEFVVDWRIAGALMERCIGLTVTELEVDSGYGRGWEIYNAFAPGTNKSGGQDYKYTKAEGDSLPRAICEACLEALSE